MRNSVDSGAIPYTCALISLIGVSDGPMFRWMGNGWEQVGLLFHICRKFTCNFRSALLATWQVPDHPKVQLCTRDLPITLNGSKVSANNRHQDCPVASSVNILWEWFARLSCSLLLRA